MAAVGGKPGIEFLLLLLPERAFGRPDRPGGRPGVDVSPISRTCAHAFFHSLRPPAPASLPLKPAAVPWRDASRPYFQRYPYARRYGAARSRSQERRGGKECVRPCGAGGAPYRLKKQKE